jgi:hypothetical protein
LVARLSFVLLVIQLNGENVGVVDNLLEGLVSNSQETGVVAEGIVDKSGELDVHGQQLLHVFFTVLKSQKYSMLFS